jgi:hypothetical protein
VTLPLAFKGKLRLESRDLCTFPTGFRETFKMFLLSFLFYFDYIQGRHAEGRRVVSNVNNITIIASPRALVYDA